MKTADDTENALDVMKICFSLFVCCSFLALFCEFGEMITEQFEMFNDELSQCKWYLFSTDVQQMFVILMAFAQKPMNICGCGKIKCTRESFKKVKQNVSIFERNFMVMHLLRISFRQLIVDFHILWHFVAFTNEMEYFLDQRLDE